jgi:hypothetical protein
MKYLFSVVLAIIICACNNKNGVKTNTALNKRSISEDIEWCHLWMVSVNSNDLPRVLIIGDSHAERYYPRVTAKLNDRAYCSKFTTSRSLGDPALIEQLRSVFFSFRFNVISFNNGLHGAEYSTEQYSQYIPQVYKLFREANPGVKLIWVNTTGSRMRDNFGLFNEYNHEVIKRNNSVENFAKENNVPLVDLYDLSVKHPEYYETDGIHFNKDGVDEEARYISDEIIKALENMNLNNK